MIVNMQSEKEQVRQVRIESKAHDEHPTPAEQRRELP